MTMINEFQAFGRNFGLLALRLGFGGMMFAAHGMGKLQTLINTGAPEKFNDPLGLFAPAVGFLLIAAAEGVCSVLIALGLFTRLAAIPLVFGMCVAAYGHHIKGDPFGKIEFPLLYAMAFLALALIGAGRYSLDRLILPRILPIWLIPGIRKSPEPETPGPDLTVEKTQ